MKVTTARYLTPRKRIIDGIGLEPDVAVVENAHARFGDPATDAQLAAAIGIVQAKARFVSAEHRRPGCESVPNARNLVLLLLTVLIWGYNWVPLKIAAVAIDPWWFGAWRVGGGALALFVVLAFTRRSMAAPPGRAYVASGSCRWQG